MLYFSVFLKETFYLLVQWIPLRRDWAAIQLPLQGVVYMNEVLGLLPITAKKQIEPGGCSDGTAVKNCTLRTQVWFPASRPGCSHNHL